MKNGWIVEATIIAIGLFAAGIMLKLGIDNFVDKDRVVSVKGLAEMEVPANQVMWPIVFNETGNDLPQLYNKINNTTNSIIKYLKTNGITDKEISTNAPKVEDMRADKYIDKDKISDRYIITSVITVTSSQVDKVRSLIASQGELLKDGIVIVYGDYNNQIQYTYTSFKELKPQMIETATKNARKAAEQFANDSQSSLGKIVSANQGQFIIEDRDSYTPYIKKIRVVTSVNYELNN